MRRWEILLLVGAIGLLVWLGHMWLKSSKKDEIKPNLGPTDCQPTRAGYQTTNPDINLTAPLSANGSPLPAEIKEDVVLEIVAGAELIYWLLDYQSGNWLLDYPEAGTRHRLCRVESDYFYYNFELAVWDQVDPQLLDQSILDLTQPNRYLLGDKQLKNFIATAIAGPDEPCQPHICAVWLASSLDSDDEIRIRVNKQRRKINDVFIVGPDGQLVVNFYYQEINIELPQPVRWLP